MRLSEAIWLGSKLKKQTFGVISRIVHFKDKHIEIRTCALGAALDAFGCLESSDIDVPTTFPEIINPVLRLVIPCPQCQRKRLFEEHTRTLNNQIAHLNDLHKWPREKIASWVAEVEAQHPELPGAVTGTLEPVEEVTTVRESRAIGVGRGLVAG